MRNVQKRPQLYARGIALLFISLLGACGGGESALIGKWTPESNRVPSGFPYDLELSKEGKGICDKVSISWKIDKNRLIVISSKTSFALNYTLSGSTLTLADDNNESAKYLSEVLLEKWREQALTEPVGSLTDKRDGREYKTKKIGEQVWMAENLNYDANGSKCYDHNIEDYNKAYCLIHGKLYDWQTAISVCPSGWHLPSDEEWHKLTKVVGGSKIAGKHLKAKKFKGSDTYGFSALPGGRGYSGGRFSDADFSGYWWSATEYASSSALNRYMYHGNDDISGDPNDKSNLYSVRCVKD